MSPNGNFLCHMGINYAAGTVKEIRVYAIDQNTGSLSLTAVYNDIPFNGATLVIDPAVKYVYIPEASNSTPAFSRAGFTVNPATGALTPLSGPGISFSNPTAGMTIVRPQ